MTDTTSLKRWHLIGFLFTCIAGTLLHFVYEWSGNSPFAAPFSAVNESTFEHLKLLLVPFLVFSILEYICYGKSRKGFLPSKVYSVLAGMLAIIAAFYTYTGIIGTNFLWADILVFLLGVFIAYFLSWYFFISDYFQGTAIRIISLILLVLLLAFTYYATFYPPELALFQNPG